MKATGREPTLYPHLGLFVRECRENGVRSCVITGGAGITRWKEMFKSACDHLRVSIDAAEPEAHAAIHCPMAGSDAFGERTAALEEIAAERLPRGLATGATFLARGENRGEAGEFVRRWAGRLDYVRLAAINYMAGGESSAEAAAAAGLAPNARLHSPLPETEDAPVKPPFACPALLARTVVTAEGNVCACHRYRELEAAGIPAVYGNLYEKPFPGIWRSERRRETIARVNEANMKSFREAGAYEAGPCAGCKYADVNRINRWMIAHMQ